MQFCDWATAFAILALLTQRQFIVELSFFWVLAGTFQRVITPDVPFDFPMFSIYFFYLSLMAGDQLHILILGAGAAPQTPVSALRLCGGQVIVALVLNYMLDSNCSMLDFLGPWP